MLWTDDDVLIDPGLARGSCSEPASNRPDAGHSWGRIEPWHESSPSKWIQPIFRCRKVQTVILYLGPRRSFCVEEQLLGVQHGFPRKTPTTTPFYLNLGRKGSESMLGEETVLIRHLKADGVQGIWVPSAKVRHYIPRERGSRRYLRSYNHGIGRTDVRMGESSEPVANWGGVPRWAICGPSSAGLHSPPRAFGRGQTGFSRMLKQHISAGSHR